MRSLSLYLEAQRIFQRPRTFAEIEDLEKDLGWQAYDRRSHSFSHRSSRFLRHHPYVREVSAVFPCDLFGGQRAVCIPVYETLRAIYVPVGVTIYIILRGHTEEEDFSHTFSFKCEEPTEKHFHSPENVDLGYDLTHNFDGEYVMFHGMYYRRWSMNLPVRRMTFVRMMIRADVETCVYLKFTVEEKGLASKDPQIEECSVGDCRFELFHGSVHQSFLNMKSSQRGTDVIAEW